MGGRGIPPAVAGEDRHGQDHAHPADVQGVGRLAGSGLPADAAQPSGRTKLPCHCRRAGWHRRLAPAVRAVLGRGCRSASKTFTRMSAVLRRLRTCAARSVQHGCNCLSRFTGEELQPTLDSFVSSPVLDRQGMAGHGVVWQGGGMSVVTSLPLARSRRCAAYAAGRTVAVTASHGMAWRHGPLPRRCRAPRGDPQQARLRPDPAQGAHRGHALRPRMRVAEQVLGPHAAAGGPAGRARPAAGLDKAVAAGRRPDRSRRQADRGGRGHAGRDPPPRGRAATLGNLSLVTVPGNGTASNRAFGDKKLWLRGSLLALNLSIPEPATWDEAAIAQRTDVPWPTWPSWCGPGPVCHDGHRAAAAMTWQG